LAETAEKVTQEGDYSVRLEVDSRNEIGQLSDVFNEMLQQVQDRDGELVRSRDVLERRVIERTKELTVAKEQAEQAARSKSQFLAAMSHEIRTPLNGVMGMSSVLSATELNDEQRDSLGMVQSSAESLLTTLNGILDFSKIEAGNIELEPSSFNVRDSFEELLDVMRIKALEKSVYLQLYIDRQVPTWIVGDIGRIRQVMMNFISNAIKFTSHGGVLVEVSSKLSEDGLYDLTFTVHDEGIGIAKNKLYDVFEQFTQLDGSTTRQYGGMGLGLSISYLLGQLMGGELSVASKLNKGSSFSLSLSLPEADREQDEAEINSNLLAGATLLIVGDVTAEHQVSAKWCRSWCDQVIATQSTDGGYTEMAKLAGGCDILILDECIGHREALLMASEFRAKYPELIIIMLVAKQIDALASIQSAGVSGYLARPVKEWQLKQGLIDLLVARDKRSNGFDVLKPFITPDSNQNKADAKTVQEQRKLRILLAEDNVVNQKVAVHMLQKLGCIVDVAANGREVIRMRKQFPYDLIFMDCHMPVLDGYDATRAIREEEQDQGNHIYIYALTANTMSDEVDLCRKVGMDGFVGKPVKINDLQYIIDNLGSDLIDNLVWPLAYN
jgi:signal transduction histidine kinase/DNA-binding response OmpR family regulator